MHKWMNCVFTGCDVRCGEYIYSGDLFCRDNTLILAGVPKTEPPRNGHVDCEVERFLEIPTTGEYRIYLFDGKIKSESGEFEKKLKNFLKTI